MSNEMQNHRDPNAHDALDAKLEALVLQALEQRAQQLDAASLSRLNRARQQALAAMPTPRALWWSSMLRRLLPVAAFACALMVALVWWQRPATNNDVELAAAGLDDNWLSYVDDTSSAESNALTLDSELDLLGLSAETDLTNEVDLELAQNLDFAAWLAATELANDHPTPQS